MAGVADAQLVRLTGWPQGLNNVAAETSLAAPELRTARNVDLADDGKPRRRRGYRRICAGSGIRGLWADPDTGLGFFAEGAALRAVDAFGTVTTILADGVSPYADVAFCRLADRVYWTDGGVTGSITDALDARPWGCPNPAGQPLVSPAAVGGLHAGTYQVAITYRDDRGEESGATLAALVDVSEGGGIQLSSIPQPNAPTVTTVRVYLSPPNGDALLHHRDLPIGITNVIVGVGFAGKPLETQFLSPMPPGQAIAALNGRLFVADGKTLRWTPALRYGLTHRANATIGFAQRIDVLIDVGEAQDGAGLYVAAGERTFFLAGWDAGATTRVIAHPYGAVPGTARAVPAAAFGIESTRRAAYWLGRNGVACLGLPGGQVVPLTAARAVADRYERGATLFCERDGIRQAITALSGHAGAQPLAVRDRLVARVTRHDGEEVP